MRGSSVFAPRWILTKGAVLKAKKVPQSLQISPTGQYSFTIGAQSTALAHSGLAVVQRHKTYFSKLLYVSV